MKATLVLLLIAGVGSTALVASAQTPTPAPAPYVYSADVVPPVPPQPPVAGGLPAQGSGAPRPNVFYSNRPQYFTFSHEETGLSQQAEQFARQLAAARSDSDREKIRGQLAEVLEKQFDQRQKRHEEEIKQLEAQIKKLKDLVDKRHENRREIIARRLDQIVRESQGLGW